MLKRCLANQTQPGVSARGLSMQQKPQFGPESFAAGTVIIRQGDLPDKFYIISRGRAEVLEQTADGRFRMIALLQPGDYFGEVGMMKNSRRVATVRALTDLDVMAMDRHTFTKWISSSSVIQDEMERTIQQRTSPEQIKPVETFKAPSESTPEPPRKKVQTGFFEAVQLEHMAMFAPGELIIRQGDLPDKFYIIVQGAVEVFRAEADGQERILQTLDSGDYFGEIGLLEGSRRIASVRAKTGVKVITFDQESFRSWMRKYPASQHEIAQTAAQRRRQTGMLPPLDEESTK